MDQFAGSFSLGEAALLNERNAICIEINEEYIEKPMLQDEKENTSGNTESKEECAVYEMKQRINLLRQQGLPESPD